MKKITQIKRRIAAKTGIAAASAALSSGAFAMDTLPIGAAIDAAEADGLAVGAMVVAAVAAMVVVGVIIGMVKKI